MNYIDITHLDGINIAHGPLYVLVAGGIASGKSHVAQKHIKGIEIIDVDNFMSKFGYTNYDPKGDEFRHAMEETAKYIKDHKAAKKSMVAMGTASNFEFAKFRLEEAKQDGYRTAILHVRVPSMSQAYVQNELRRHKGERAVAPKDLEILFTTANNSTDTVGRLIRDHRDLVDYYTAYVNVPNYANQTFDLVKVGA